MTTAETWAHRHSQSGPFDQVDNMRDLVKLIRDIQRDAAEPSFGNIGPECPSCGRDNSEDGCVCTSDDCPAHGREILGRGDSERLTWLIDCGAYSLVDGDEYFETGAELQMAVRKQIDEHMSLREHKR